MSQKTITILLVILVALVGAYFLQKSLSHPSTDLKSFSELKVTFEPSMVQHVQVYKQDYPDSGLFFARKDTSWVVSNQYNASARSKDVEQILSDLTKIGGTLRGETEDLYTDFAITDQNALQIKLLGADNSLLAHVYVGKGGPDGKSCFIRLPGSPKVYLADNNFISRFSAWGAAPEKRLPADRWMNLNLCKTARDNNMSAFKVHTPKIDYEFASVSKPPVDTMSPPTKTWEQVAPKKGKVLDEDKIRSLQSIISNLMAQGVTDPANATRYNLDKPSYSVWVSDSLGNSVFMNFGDKVDTLDNRYVTVSSDNLVYKVNKGVFERVFVTPFEPPKDEKAAVKPKK
jgi:hypothetical protein